MTIDMSPEAITHRMIELDQIWELSLAIRSSQIIENNDDIESKDEPEGETPSDDRG